MAHVDLRTLDDADLDAIAEASAGSAARGDLDAWAERHRSHDDASVMSITRDGEPIGVAAAFAVGGDRTLALRLTPTAEDADAAAALRLLVAREAERPLYARAERGDESAAVFRAGGFSELPHAATPDADGATATAATASGGEVVLVLPPTLDGV